MAVSDGLIFIFGGAVLDLERGTPHHEPGHVASPSQLLTSAANAAMPSELQFSAISKGPLWQLPQFPPLRGQTHIARSARSMCSDPVMVPVNLRLRSKTHIFVLVERTFPQNSLRKVSVVSNSLLRTKKFEKAIVIHFAIVVPAARHNFDGSNLIQICRKAR